MLRFALLLSLALPSLPHAAMADTFTLVREQSAFVALIEGRDLRLSTFGIRLSLTADGRIAGEALGSTVTGTWKWRDGYFCRDMAWRGRPIPFNCQLVEARGDQLRFTSDKGQGQSARFRLD